MLEKIRTSHQQSIECPRAIEEMAVTQTEVLLPLSLIGLNLCLKLFVGRQVQIYHVAETLIELPRDLALQSTAFIVAFAISSPTNMRSGVLFLFGYVIWLVIVTFLYRAANDSLHRERVYATIACSFITLIISVAALLFSIQTLTGVTLIGY